MTTGSAMAWVRAHRLRLVVGAWLALALVWGGFAVLRSDVPERVVRDYLTAVREQRVDRALKLVEVDSDTDRTLLEAKAISREWRIVSVLRTDSNNLQTFVDAMIEGPDGKATGTFELMQDDGVWRIQNPFVELTLAGPLAYLELNGARYPWSKINNGESLALFPGFYRFYGSTRDLLSVTPSSSTLVPEWGRILPARVIEGKATRAATRDTQRAVEAYLTECAKSTERSPLNCPFGLDASFVRMRDGYYFDVEDVRWKVTRQPEVYLEAYGPGFMLIDRDLATVQLSAMATDEADRRRRITLTCPIEVNYLGMTLDGATPKVAPLQFDSPAPRTHATCH
ncbi:MAG: hypothetical protein ACRDT4_09510 [Micromonosporaceae bacterium]